MTDPAEVVTGQDRANVREAQTQDDEGVAILTALLNKAQERSQQRQAAAQSIRVSESARALYNRD